MYYYLLYIGISRKTFKKEDFDELLYQARSRNKFLGITGKLFHCEGTFIQLLEGKEEAVNEVYQSICDDERLIAVKTVITGKATERYYKDWSMAFSDVSLEEINEMEKCTHLDVAAYIRNSSAVKLLKLLAKS